RIIVNEIICLGSNASRYLSSTLLDIFLQFSPVGKVVHTACDHKLFAIQGKTALLFYLFQFQMRKKMAEFSHVFFIRKILCISLCDNWDDSFYTAGFLRRSLDHFLQII